MTWDTNLEKAFHPKTIAIVGVSSEAKRGAPWAPGGTSFITSHEKLGFGGRIYPVNPKASEVLGYKAYPTVSSIPESVALVFHSFLNDPWESELRVRLRVELPNKGIPVFSTLAGAGRAMGRLAEYYRFKNRPAIGI